MLKSVSNRSALVLTLGLASLTASSAEAQLRWSLAGGSEGWPAWARDAVKQSMDEAVAIYNQHGFFEKQLTAGYNAGVPTAEGNVDGWITFGGSHNTRVALHEISHTLGTAYYWATGSGTVNENTAAGRLVKLFDGQGAVLNTGGTHFWPYNMNFDNEDGPAARERLVKLIAAFRFDAGIVKDSDRDGLPDDWEQHHFTSLREDGKGDPDADGISNTDEYNSDSDPNAPCPVRDGESYVVRNQRSGRALTAADAGLVVGTRLALRMADGSALQTWTARYVGQGFFRFTPSGSDLVLQTPGKDTASGRPIELAANTNAFQQQWRVVSGAGAQPNHYQIANRETGRVMDALDAAEGAPVQQYPFLGNITQQFWRFERVGQSEDVADAGVDGGIASTSDAGRVDIPDASPVDAALSRDGSVLADAAVGGGVQTSSGDSGPDDAASSNDGGCSLARPGHKDELAVLGLMALVGLVLRARRRREREVENTFV